MSADDTIYALASGSGMAALAVVRVSGSLTRALLVALSGRCPNAREYSLVTLRDPLNSEILDKCVCVWLPGPRSYTGEDSAELFLHSSRATIKAVFQAISRMPGFRMAEPGEFTRRAVLNGKMDLVEAEGLGDLLTAETSQQRRQALGLMTGQASSVFDRWRQNLIHIRSDIEAVLDFADEPGVAEEASSRIDSDTRKLIVEMERELSRAEVARTIRDGVRVVLAGPPNTGKSSLLNAVAGREAAIVSAIPGTTRDVIEVRMEIAGLPVVLMDTAGLREGLDDIEREGIKRSRSQIAEADVIVWVSADDVPASKVLPADMLADLCVAGKSDLFPLKSIDDNWIALSAQTGAGLEQLVGKLSDIVRTKFASRESPVVVSARQQECTEASIRCLNDSLGIASSYLELKAVHIRAACDHIGRVTGRVDVEEWLGQSSADSASGSSTTFHVKQF